MRKKWKHGLITTGLLIFNLCFSFSQPWPIGETKLELIDNSRDGRKIKTTIFYPAEESGFNVPAARNVNGKFQVIAFGHGYRMPGRAYRNLWELIVPGGFIFIIPESETRMFPSHSELGRDLAFSIEEITSLGRDSSSLFFGITDTSGCIMGHSMGGGSAILGAAHSDVIKSLLVLAPLDTRPSSVEAAAMLSIPALIISGSSDCITTPQEHHEPIYDSLRSSRKTFISIIGGSHCQMACKSCICSFAERTCKPKAGISREEQHRVMNRYILPWLRFYLKGEEAQGELFNELIREDPAIAYKRQGMIQE